MKQMSGKDVEALPNHLFPISRPTDHDKHQDFQIDALKYKTENYVNLGKSRFIPSPES